MNKKQNLKRRWFYLFTGVVAMLFAGIIYAWSILKAPFATEFGWQPSALAFNFTITMSSFCLGGLAGAKLSKKTGIRISLIIAAVLSVLGFVGTSFITRDYVILLYILYGVIAGGGIGIAYNVIISTVNQWFTDKKGICSGCLMMGFGASALVLGNIANGLMENPLIGWRNTYIIIGVLLGIVLMSASIILKRPEADMSVSDKLSDINKEQAGEYTTSKMMKTANFWLAFFCILGLIAVGSSVISFAKDLTLSVGASVGLATSLVGVLSMFNGLGRILTGSLFDHVGQRKTMLIANGASIAAAAVILVAVMISSLPLCIFGLCLTGISYGACPTIASAFTMELFGAKHFANNMAVMNLNLMFGSFVATISSSLFTLTGAYVIPFAVLTVASIVALILNINIRRS